MTSRVSDIDNEFASEVALVKTHYCALEEKLKITDRKERTEMDHGSQAENDQDTAGIDREDKTAVVEDTVTVTQEVKVVGNGQEVKMGDGHIGQVVNEGAGRVNRVGTVQMDKMEVDCSDEIGPHVGDENKSEVTNSVKVVGEEMAKVSPDSSTDVL